MAEEDIQKLHSEIESLRKENQRLKIAASHHLGIHKNGSQEESPVLEKEPILKVLSKQLDDLKRLNLQAKNMLEGYQEIQKSLGAILPALELQMEGWTNEVQNLQKHIDESESAYAAVVIQLEDKLGKAKKELKQNQEASKAGEILRLQQELERYKAEFRKHNDVRPLEQENEEDPFTDLNIFGP